MLPLESTLSPDSAHTFQQSPTSLKGSSVQAWFKPIFVGAWINKPCWVRLLDLSMRRFSLLLLFRALMYLWFVFVSWGRCFLKCLSEVGSSQKEEDEACTGLLKACNCLWMRCLYTGCYCAFSLPDCPPANPAGCFVYGIIPQFLVMLEFSGC